MNQKELSTLKRNFKMDNDNLHIGAVLTAYVSMQGGVSITKFRRLLPFDEMPSEEAEINMAILRKTVSGQLGKGCVQYPYSNGSGGNPAQAMLDRFRKQALQDEAAADELLGYLVEHYQSEGDYYICSAVCEYLIPVKDKNDEEAMDRPPARVSFLLTGFCPVALTDIGLIYDSGCSEIIKKVNTDLQVKPGTRDGFMFPVLCEDGLDVNAVLYYTSTPKKPNTGMVETMLGGTFELSSEEETAAFAGVLQSLSEDSWLKFSEVSRLQDAIACAMEESAKDEQDELLLDRYEMLSVLEDAGLEEEVLEGFDSAYKKEVDGRTIHAVNAMDTKKVCLELDGIKVSAKADRKEAISTREVEGVKYLMIELDGPIRYNGIEVHP